MFLGLAQAAWRGVLLLALGIAPWALPVEASPAASVGIAALRMAAFVGVAGALAVLVRASLRAGDRWLAALASAALLLAVVPPAVLVGDRGPLGRGAWIVAPVDWALLALLAHRAASRARVRAAAVRAVAAGVVAALGVGSVAAARSRLREPRIWDEALRADPGDEEAAVRAADRRDAAHDRAGAYAVLAACAARRPDACRCAEGAASDALDLGKYPEARAVLEASERTRACAPTSHRKGLTAEALVFTTETAAGVPMANAVLAQDDAEPHANFALGYLASRRGDLPSARDYAVKAVAGGRGAPARLLLGMILIQQQDLDGARTELTRALQSDPKSAPVVFDLAYVADRKGLYHEAREGYLRALALDPKLADARYNLVVLTYRHGAAAEATHHLERLAADAPGDPRLPGLRAMLARASR